MEKIEFLRIAEMLKTAYPKENIIPNKEAMEVWYVMLKDIEYRTAQAAVKEYIALKKFPPTIADIREMAAPKDDWSNAWGEVQRAIRRFGWARPKEALESMSEKTRAIVRRFGWQEICTAENVGVLRGQFRAAYEAAGNTAQLPEELRKELESGRDTKSLTGDIKQITDNKAGN